jgi:hypothetical protein
MKRFLLLLVLFTPALAGAQQFSSLEERMSSADFAAAGLDKLSPEELARLNEWLRGNVGASAGAAAVASREDRIGFREEMVTGVVVSQIDGTFTGWTGKTRFRLKNGQVWQQIDTDARFGGVELDSPGVRIEPGLFGSWMLKVDGYNSQVRVKRLD